MEAPLTPVSFFLQGRWWCETCRVQWGGSWEVPEIAPHIEQGDEWAPVHDCGTTMRRTEGDDRVDYAEKASS